LQKKEVSYDNLQDKGGGVMAIFPRNYGVNYGVNRAKYAPLEVEQLIVEQLDVPSLVNLALVDKESYAAVKEKTNTIGAGIKMKNFCTQRGNGKNDVPNLYYFVEQSLKSLEGCPSEIDSFGVVIALRGIYERTTKSKDPLKKFIQKVQAINSKLLLAPANIKIYFVGIDTIKSLRANKSNYGNDFIISVIPKLCMSIGSRKATGYDEPSSQWESRGLLTDERNEILTQAAKALACYIPPPKRSQTDEFIGSIVEACCGEFAHAYALRCRYNVQLMNIACEVIESETTHPHVAKVVEMLKTLDGSLFLKIGAISVADMFGRIWALCGNDDLRKKIAKAITAVLRPWPTEAKPAQKNARGISGLSAIVQFSDQDVETVRRNRQNETLLAFATQVANAVKAELTREELLTIISSIRQARDQQ
jgi:hypothetical protein